MLSGVSATLRTPVTSTPPAPRLRWRQPIRSEARMHRGGNSGCTEVGTVAAPELQPYSMDDGSSGRTMAVNRTWRDSGCTGVQPYNLRERIAN